MEFDLVSRYHGGYENGYGDREFYEEHGFHVRSFDIEVNGNVFNEIETTDYEELVFDGMPNLDGNLSRNDEKMVTAYLVDEGFVDEGMVWSGMIY